jgi:hypothetical protein
MTKNLFSIILGTDGENSYLIEIDKITPISFKNTPKLQDSF